MKRISSKKGSVYDVYLIIGILLVLSLVSMLVLKVLTEVRTQFEDDDILKPEQLGYITNVEDRYGRIIDGIFLFFLVGVCITVLIAAFLVRTYPFFYFFSIIVIAIFIFVSAIMANVYQEFADNDDLASTAEQFVVIGYIMPRLPFYTLIISILIAVVMFSKGGSTL